MELYIRNINRDILRIRLSFFVLLLLGSYAFFQGNEIVFYCLVIGFLLMSLIIVNNIIIFTDSFTISKYFFFGFIKKTWIFNKDDTIKAFSPGSGFGQIADKQEFEDIGNVLGCLLSIFSVFLPSIIVKKKFKIEKTDCIGNGFDRVFIVLTEKEYKSILHFLSNQKTTFD